MKEFIERIFGNKPKKKEVREEYEGERNFDKKDSTKSNLSGYYNSYIKSGF